MLPSKKANSDVIPVAGNDSAVVVHASKLDRAGDFGHSCCLAARQVFRTRAKLGFPSAFT